MTCAATQMFWSHVITEVEILPHWKALWIYWVKFNLLKIKADTWLAWYKLLGRLYYRLSSASEIEIQEILKNNPNISDEIAKDFAIQRQIELKGNKLLRDMMNEATIEYK